MKTLKQTINEKLILSTNKRKYNYTPQNRNQLIDIIDKKSEKDNVIDVSDIDISQLIRPKLSLVFCYNSNITEINGLDTWDTSEIETMHGMFQECSNLRKINLSTWDVSKVRRFDGMFDGCFYLEDIGDISNWKIQDGAYCVEMFKGCNAKFVNKYKKYFKKNILEI
jgi:surface protein